MGDGREVTLLNTKCVTENVFSIMIGNVISFQKKKKKGELVSYKCTLTSKFKVVLTCITATPILASINDIK